MAKSYYSLGRSLSRAEAIAGWCYLPFYLVLLSAGIQYLAAALHVSLTALTINIIYFSVNLLFVLLIFRNFLLQRFFGSGFWNFVQALILGFALYYAGTWAVQALEHLLAGQVTIYNNETVNDLIFENRYVMLAVSVIFAPVIEEIANEYAGKVKVGKVNVDDERELALEYGVSSIPTVMVFQNGEVKETSVGYRPKEEIEQLLK